MIQIKLGSFQGTFSWHFEEKTNFLLFSSFITSSFFSSSLTTTTFYGRILLVQNVSIPSWHVFDSSFFLSSFVFIQLTNFESIDDDHSFLWWQLKWTQNSCTYTGTTFTTFQNWVIDQLLNRIDRFSWLLQVARDSFGTESLISWTKVRRLIQLIPFPITINCIVQTPSKSFHLNPSHDLSISAPKFH